MEMGVDFEVGKEEQAAGAGRGVAHMGVERRGRIVGIRCGGQSRS